MTDAQPVFEAIVKNCRNLFSGSGVVLRLLDNGKLAARAGVGTALGAVPVDAESAVGACVIQGRIIHLPDLNAAAVQYPLIRNMGLRMGFRSGIYAPLLREGRAIGTITVLRPEVGAFNDKDVALLSTFADQAVIAIENVRLFKELQSRTEALTKSVGQLTALGEVGQAISSTLDLETVLQTIVSHAVQLTGLDNGTIYEFDTASESFQLRATKNMPEEMIKAYREKPIRLGESVVGRAGSTREPVQVPDIEDVSYQARYKEMLLRAGYRAILAVPLVREEQVVGAITVSRGKPGAFAPEVVELLKTFASQSALAIQNARLFREIEEKGKQLEVASRHKSDFLANMSHELRTPLNAVIGFSEVLIERMFGDLNEKQADYMKDIHESGKHLLSLINDILDLSKIEAGRMDLELGSFDLPGALANAITLVRERAQRHGIALGLEVDPAIGAFTADERKFKQILLNLLSNAVKFTPDGGRVDVAAKLNGQSVEIAVKDTGVGIAPGDQAAVFEEFKQVGSDYTKKAEGTGLGLALTRRFVELHGGEIRLESSIGAGSTFTFTLPVRP